MTSAIELSIQFGLPVKKIEEICDFLNIELDNENFDINAEFENIARLVKRKRTSAFVLAWVYSKATDDQRDFIFGIDPEFQTEYELLDLPIGDDEYFSNADMVLDKLALDSDDKSLWLALAEWIKTICQRANRPVNHSYLAVRLLLSLRKKDMKNYPSTIAKILNRARYRKYLDGWFNTIEKDGKNTVIYHMPEISAKPAKPLIQLDISDAEIARYIERLGNSDPVKLAGFIAWEKELDSKLVLAFLNQKTFDL